MLTSTAAGRPLRVIDHPILLAGNTIHDLGEPSLDGRERQRLAGMTRIIATIGPDLYESHILPQHRSDPRPDRSGAGVRAAAQNHGSNR